MKMKNKLPFSYNETLQSIHERNKEDFELIFFQHKMQN